MTNRLVCVILFIDKKISCAFDRKFNWILFTMIERTKHGGHITDVDGNIKAFPNY